MSTEKEINKAIARNIIKNLAKNNMTQAELAAAVGVSEATVSNWCKGVKMPRMQKFDAICNVLGCSRSDLFEQREPGLHEPLPKKLSSDEELLLEYYSKLNKPGKENLLEYAEMLTYNPKYKKESLKEA